MFYAISHFWLNISLMPDHNFKERKKTEPTVLIRIGKTEVLLQKIHVTPQHRVCRKRAFPPFHISASKRGSDRYCS